MPPAHHMLWQFSVTQSTRNSNLCQGSPPARYTSSPNFTQTGNYHCKPTDLHDLMSITLQIIIMPACVSPTEGKEQSIKTSLCSTLKMVAQYIVICGHDRFSQHATPDLATICHTQNVPNALAVLCDQSTRNSGLTANLCHRYCRGLPPPPVTPLLTSLEPILKIWYKEMH